MSAHSKKKKIEINLLPVKGYESTIAGRVLAWILSTFRVIVIVTEIIVMGAFLSRFWLDAQNTDLNEKISMKQAVLSASKTFENDFKDAQKRLDVFKILINSQLGINNSFAKVTSFVPPDVKLTKFQITQQGVEITAETPNEKSIQQTLVNLNENEDTVFTLSEIKTRIDNPNIVVFTLKNDVVKTDTQ